MSISLKQIVIVGLTVNAITAILAQALTINGRSTQQVVANFDSLDCASAALLISSQCSQIGRRGFETETDQCEFPNTDNGEEPSVRSFVLSRGHLQRRLGAALACMQ